MMVGIQYRTVHATYERPVRAVHFYDSGPRRRTALSVFIGAEPGRERGQTRGNSNVRLEQWLSFQ